MQRVSIPKILPANYYVVSNTYAYANTLFTLGLLLSSFYLLGALHFWPAMMMMSIFIALQCYRLTVFVHDCSHFSLYSSRQQNIFWGWVFSGFLFTDFEHFRRLHGQHHTSYCTSEDPQGEDYNYVEPNRQSVMLHLLAPLYGGNFLAKFKTFFILNKNKKAGSEKIISPSRRQYFISVFLVQCLILSLTFWSQKSLIPYLLYVLFLVPFGLFMSRLRGYLEHGKILKSGEPSKIVRTHKSNLIESFFLAPLNFHYHYEHHLWPNVPSVHLREIHKQYTLANLESYEYTSTYMGSLVRIWRNMK